MAKIEGIRIQNFRALKDVTLGRTSDNRDADPLPKMLAAIGPNGSGKSTLMDALGFIGDCLSEGVEEACNKPHRGGFQRLRTQGVEEPIRLDIYYRQSEQDNPIGYTVEIALDDNQRPYVVSELAKQRTSKTSGRYFEFLKISGSTATAWAGKTLNKKNKKHRRTLKLDDRRRLGIATLGNLSDHPRIVEFRAFLEGWYLSYFVPDVARGLPMAGAQRHLNKRGDNLANYVQFMEQEHAARFDRILREIAKNIPGVRKIRTKTAPDGRLLIQFNDRGFKDPFFATDMSDGTLKTFAYLLLLEDPDPAPLIGIEEPENGLHHQLLGPLATEMKRRAQEEKGPQVFVTTHSPYFVDALLPTEVFILDKSPDGYTTIVRAADIKGIPELSAEGIPLGSLWYSDHFGKGNP
ncbi:MAG TPA: AAA family ATPase [Polyangiaceae bacterium]|jgi:predicted ATPase